MQPPMAILYAWRSRVSSPAAWLRCYTVLSSSKCLALRVAVSGTLLNPEHATGTLTLSSYNPNHVPFTYTLRVLGEPNHAPAFTSQPNMEAIPRLSYVYQATATDPDGDALRYALLTG